MFLLCKRLFNLRFWARIHDQRDEHEKGNGSIFHKLNEHKGSEEWLDHHLSGDKPVGMHSLCRCLPFLLVVKMGRLF
jgi:hypothetical protein